MDRWIERWRGGRMDGQMDKRVNVKRVRGLRVEGGREAQGRKVKVRAIECNGELLV